MTKRDLILVASRAMALYLIFWALDHLSYVPVDAPRGSVQKRPTGVRSKPANGSGPEPVEVLADRELFRQGESVFSLKALKKSH